MRASGFSARGSTTGRLVAILIYCSNFPPVANPALTAASLSARVSRLFQGRRVDVLILAPNLKRFPIHDLACVQGQLL